MPTEAAPPSHCQGSMGMGVVGLGELLVLHQARLVVRIKYLPLWLHTGQHRKVRSCGSCRHSQDLGICSEVEGMPLRTPASHTLYWPEILPSLSCGRSRRTDDTSLPWQGWWYVPLPHSRSSVPLGCPASRQLPAPFKVKCPPRMSPTCVSITHVCEDTKLADWLRTGQG